MSAATARPLVHDERALARFELFLFSAVATVLVTRTLLAVTGYPQVGGSSGLHVAHVLWGGLLMAVAIVLVEILPGTRIRLRAAFIGGIGFGLFIDEIGKFLTKDVDYFFKPAIAIIYAVFVVFYLTVREVLQHRVLTDRRRLALGSIALADLALGQLDERARDDAIALLDGVQDGELAQAAAAVRAGLFAERVARPGIESRLSALRDRLIARVERLLGSRIVLRVVVALFAIEAVEIVFDAALSFAHPGRARGLRVFLDTGVPSAVSAILVVVGVVRLAQGVRQPALRWLQRAVLIELLFTQVIVFNREQWAGLVGFGVDLTVLWVLRLAVLAGDPTR